MSLFSALLTLLRTQILNSINLQNLDLLALFVVLVGDLFVGGLWSGLGPDFIFYVFRCLHIKPMENLYELTSGRARPWSGLGPEPAPTNKYEGPTNKSGGPTNKS